MNDFWHELSSLDFVPGYAAKRLNMGQVRQEVISEAVANNPRLKAIQRLELLPTKVVRPIVEANNSIHFPYFNSRVNTPEYKHEFAEAKAKLDGVVDMGNEGTLISTDLGKSLSIPWKPIILSLGSGLLLGLVMWVATASSGRAQSWMFLLITMVLFCILGTTLSIQDVWFECRGRKKSAQWLWRMAYDVEAALTPPKD